MSCLIGLRHITNTTGPGHEVPFNFELEFSTHALSAPLLCLRDQKNRQDRHLRLNRNSVARSREDNVVNRWIKKHQPEEQPRPGLPQASARPSPRTSHEEARKSEFLTSFIHRGSGVIRRPSPEIYKSLQAQRHETNRICLNVSIACRFRIATYAISPIA